MLKRICITSLLIVLSSNRYAAAQNDMGAAAAGVRTESDARCSPEKARTVTADRAIKLVYYTINKHWDADGVCWGRIAVAKGEMKGYVAIGDVYRMSANDNVNVFAWYLKGAQAGDPESMRWVSYMYRYGLGVDKNVTYADGWAAVLEAHGGAKQQSATEGETVAALAFGALFANGSRNAASAIEAQPAPGVDPEGWEKLRWGMTKAQVQRIYPKATQFRNRDGDLKLGFEEFRAGDQLYTVEFGFDWKTGGLERVDLEPVVPLIYVGGLEEEVRGYFEPRLTAQFGEPKTDNKYGIASTEWGLKDTRVVMMITPGRAEGVKQNV